MDIPAAAPNSSSAPSIPGNRRSRFRRFSYSARQWVHLKVLSNEEVYASYVPDFGWKYVTVNASYVPDYGNIVSTNSCQAQIHVFHPEKLLKPGLLQHTFLPQTEEAGELLKRCRDKQLNMRSCCK